MIFLQKGVKLVLQTHEMKTDDRNTFCKNLLNGFFIHIFLIYIKLIIEIYRQQSPVIMYVINLVFSRTNNQNHKERSA